MPLFQRYGVEDQLAAMYQPVVQLKSGGYLVINPTEALVSIDINSGRSTREHNIEQTAYATNIEAANEIARQLRLRDMAGLVVIDFIDMELNGHIRKVEKAMKDALKNDRARIQVGRISSFGLMEMSRQRLRTGVLEASTRPCPHCEGSGLMRTAASSGLSALRMIEDEAARGRGSRIMLRAGREAAIYVLNRKRGEIGEIEDRYGVIVEVLIEESFEGARMAVESLGPPPTQRPRARRPARRPISTRRISRKRRTRSRRTRKKPSRSRAREAARRTRRARRASRGRAVGGGSRRAPPPPPPRTPRRTQPHGRGRASRAARRPETEAGERREPPLRACDRVRRGARPPSPPRPTKAPATKPKSRRRPRARRKVPKRRLPRHRGRVSRSRPPSLPPHRPPNRLPRLPKSRPPSRSVRAARRRRSRKPNPPPRRPLPPPPTTRPTGAPRRQASDDDTCGRRGGPPRRGWWQRTFGPEPGPTGVSARASGPRSCPVQGRTAGGDAWLTQPSHPPRRRLCRAPPPLLVLSFAVAVAPLMRRRSCATPRPRHWFRDMARPIIAAGGAQAENVQIVLLHDNSINAFVVDGQIVYIHSGLIAAADNANQVQGVIAHELGHIVGGHVDPHGRGREGRDRHHAALAAARRGGDGGRLRRRRRGHHGGGTAGGDGQVPRLQPHPGELGRPGRRHLPRRVPASAAGARSSFFKKLQNQEYRYAIPQDDAYARTHPLTRERIAGARGAAQERPAWDQQDRPGARRALPAGQGEARRLRPGPEADAHPLSGDQQERAGALCPRLCLAQERLSRQSRWPRPTACVAATRTDPFYLELKGQILLRSGHPDEALESLREPSPARRSSR